jgi:hypothetical protein
LITFIPLIFTYLHTVQTLNSHLYVFCITFISNIALQSYKITIKTQRMTKINTASKRPDDISPEAGKEHRDFLAWVLDMKLTLRLMVSQWDAIKQEMNSYHDRNEIIRDAGYWHQDSLKKALKMMENKERFRVVKIMILTFKTGENVPTKQPVKRPKLALKPDFLKRLFTVISAVLTPFLR